MRKAALLLSLLVLASPVAAAARNPVLVELYTAQGCASCTDANAHAAKLADRQGVLVLTFPVDYWDYLGWADTFAKPEFTQRQRTYVTRLNLREPYTPQVVVGGSEQAPGVRADAVDRLVRDAQAARRVGPDIRFLTARRADVGSGRASKGGADVWLVRFDPREQEIAVKSGDNRGKTVVQKNVVRELTRLGPWRGRPTAYRLPPASDEGLRSALLVQERRGGRVIAVGLEGS